MKMTARHWLLGTGLLIVTALSIFAPAPDDAGTAGVVGPALRKVSANTGPLSDAETASARAQDAVVIQAVVPRNTLVGDVADGSDDLFGSQKWAQAPVPAAQSAAFVPLLPAVKPVPQAPPFPYVFQGKADGAGGWNVFLLKGDLVFVVREKMTFDASYRVESIRPPYMVVTYLPLNMAQQIDIGAAE